MRTHKGKHGAKEGEDGEIEGLSIHKAGIDALTNLFASRKGEIKGGKKAYGTPSDARTRNEDGAKAKIPRGDRSS